jgi:26S proteasome regulatory subunit N2
MYGKEEEADGQITQLLNEKDAILRYGGVYTMGLAYVGTSNDRIVKDLLHVAVSDVDYDVRRAAVTCIGLIMYKNSEMVPNIVGLLSGSYNPYVRQGACMAIGIACASNPNPEALKILEGLQTDPQNFVRQAAMVATAMLLCTANTKTSDKLEEFKEKLDKVIKDKS